MIAKGLQQNQLHNSCEYLLLIKPHQELCNKIMFIKEQFSKKYNTSLSIYEKPNITLLRYKQLEILEEKIINHLQNTAREYAPFKVELRNFGNYPTHSIYINIESKQQVKNLIKEIRSVQRVMKFDKFNKPHFLDNPNIAIAGKLLPWQYEKAWLEYSNLEFTGRFMANSMPLLKRKEGEGFKFLRKFEFLNIPVTTKQGDLFM